MAISKGLAKSHYKDFSVEQLEKEYERIKKEYYFESKEEEIVHIIDIDLDASYTINRDNTRCALEELLKEKTGKVYKIEEKHYKIKLKDIINYVAKSNADSSSARALNIFFRKLLFVPKFEKKDFLIKLVQDKKIYNDFLKDISNNKSTIEIFKKYKNILKEYVKWHTMIG